MLRSYEISKLRVRLLALASCTFCSLGMSFGSVNVKLTTSVPSGAPVGTTVNMVASASDTTNPKAFFVYQFNVGQVGKPLAVRRNFYTFNSFPWTPTDWEGAYNLQVVVHSSTGAVGYASGVFNVTSRVTGSAPVITRIAHPLVALYSMPACAAGETARVRFKMPSDAVWQTTSLKNCTGNTSLNFYVAGMRGSTTYQIQQDVFHGPFSTIGPLMSFTTGPVPTNLPISKFALVKRSPAPNDSAYPVLLNGPTGSIPFATDSTGALIWYLPPQSVVINYLTRPIPGGTFFTATSDGSSIRDNRLFREYDLAGNLVRETNYATTADYLARHGADPITSMHHDAILLPNGYIALICSVEKVANQGDGPVDVIGDQVVVVDSNFQVKWWWNEFDHLDIMRKAVLDEKCTGSAGCPHLYNPNYKVANDWTHSNALTYSKADGDLLISSRHQDWVMKFRYANGAGDGKLLWRLGDQGDFKVNASVANPWFSHQHNIEFEPNGNLSLFDNGNTRIQAHGGNSRGQAWNLNQSSMLANLVTNIDLGAFSLATGSAQLLSNGNYTFDLGFVGAASETKEYGPSNTLVMQQNLAQNSYRSFRMRSLYQEY